MQLNPIKNERQIPYPGPFFMLGAAFFFSWMNLGVRLLRETMPPDVLVFYRSGFQVLILSFYWKEFLPPREFFFKGLWEKGKLHVPRGFFGVISMVFLYIAMQQLPVALASLLTMTSVLWAMLLERVFLKESLSPRQALFGLIAMIGILLSLFPAGGEGAWHLNLLGTVGALMCGFCSGCAYTLLRKMRRKIGTKEIVFYFGCTGVLMTAPSAFAHFRLPATAKEVFLILFVGASASAAQLLMTTGFKHTTASVASIVNLQQVTFSLILGTVFLGETPPPLFYYGALFVFFGLWGLFERKRLAPPSV